MLDDDTTVGTTPESTPTGGDAAPTDAAEPGTVTDVPAKKAAAKKAAKKAPAKKAAASPTKKAAAKAPAKTTAKKAAKKTAKSAASDDQAALDLAGAEAPDLSSIAAGTASDPEIQARAEAEGEAAPAGGAPAKKTAKKATKAAKKATAKKSPAGAAAGPDAGPDGDTAAGPQAAASAEGPGPIAVLFQPPTVTSTEQTGDSGRPAAKKTAKKAAKKSAARRSADQAAETVEAASDEELEPSVAAEATAPAEGAEGTDEADTAEGAEGAEGEGTARRRRRRGGRRRRKPGAGGEADESSDGSDDPDAASEQRGESDQTSPEADQPTAEGTSRRRRRRRRAGEEGDDEADSSGGSGGNAKTVTRVRKPRSPEDEITGFTGSTRLEAKKQRRREGREAGRRRAPIISEAEFLARRESVDRVMVIRQRKDLTQIGVLEDKVLVEHYVARESQTSLIGNVYLGRVQNVLPSMEAAFIDIGKGRNAVLYAGEVNWDAFGARDGNQRKIEAVLKPGQSVLVQVSKDPIGHKGARLTSQISLPGRFLVYVPDGTTSGISRKLPDTERNRLKSLLKEIVPESAGVIVRTAAEGASEEELTRDVERLKARWEDIEKKVEGGNAPQLLYGEPDLTLKVVRDLFTEDFAKLVVSGNEAWKTVSEYVEQVAPDLADRLEKHDASKDGDVFAVYRIDEQIAKGLDRKVWLPSGGSLVIDRTEAMTVIDVNTGKFTGSGGNLEETVTKNNLEAAEEIVRQLRLRDIGGIVVVDFIDMVLESNRDLVLRRLVECLGRDRTRHQVAEVTSLGLVQMTRKRIGTGLLEAFSETCDHCQGRGLIVHHEPVEQKKKAEEEPRRGRRRGGRGRADDSAEATPAASSKVPTPADIAAMARHEHPHDDDHEHDEHDEHGLGHDDEPDPLDDRESARDDHDEELEALHDEPSSNDNDHTENSTDSTGSGGSSGSYDGAGPDRDGVPAEDASSEPAEEATDAAAVEQQPPAAPRVTTSVRRVSARRPAGPPRHAGNQAVHGSPALQEADEQPVAQGVAVEVGVAEPVVAAHVPVKKKGSRKR